MNPKVKQAVIDNPVTSVAAVGAIIAMLGHFFNWDAETQLVVAQGILGVALLFRLAVAWAKAQ